MIRREGATVRGVRSLRSSQWVALGTVLALIGLFVLNTAGMWGLASAHRISTRLANEIVPARLAAQEWEQAVLSEANAVNSFVLTGEDRVLQPYYTGVERASDAVSQLETLLGHGTDPHLRELITGTRDSMDNWESTYAHPMIDQIAREGPGSVPSVLLSRSNEELTQVRRSLGQIRLLLEERMDATSTELRRARTLSWAFLASVTGLQLLLALVLTTVIRLGITRPLERLARDVRQVAEGDFDHPVRARGPADVAGLAEDVESMRRRILAELAGARRSREQLDRQAAELRRSNAELEQFAYVASHDLQEPLRKVAGFCQLLARRYRGRLDERADTYLDFAVDGARRMQVLINDLLAFSRVGRVGTRTERVELDRCLAAALDNLEAAVEEAGAEVTADPLPVVTGDATLLTLLLQNLVGNSVKFRSPDRPCRIRITVRARGEEWEFACADNGIGVDPRFAERVFVIFQRLHPKDEYAGTGIGLAMSRKIVEHHGGRIWLDPEHSPGACVRWTLPARPLPSPPR